MTRHRFILPSDALPQPDTPSTEIVFPEEQSRQIYRVLRLRPGSSVIASDGQGREWQINLTDVTARRVTGLIEDYVQRGPDTRAFLTLYQSLLKASKYELVLQKCTEIGVQSFVPVTSARCVPSELSGARADRFRSIVREAAEQSGRATMPLVEPLPRPLENAVRSAVDDGIAIVLWEDEHTIHLRNLPVWNHDTPVSLFVGPEGGFAREEIETAQTYGAHIVSLGSRVLRAETAAIVGSALVLARTGDLG